MFPGWSEHCNAEGTLYKYSRNIVCWLGCTDIGIPISGEFEEKEELKNLLKWVIFSFYVMVDYKIVTCLKNKKLVILIVNKEFKIFDF